MCIRMHIFDLQHFKSTLAEMEQYKRYGYIFFWCVCVCLFLCFKLWESHFHFLCLFLRSSSTSQKHVLQLDECLTSDLWSLWLPGHYFSYSSRWSPWQCTSFYFFHGYWWTAPETENYRCGTADIWEVCVWVSAHIKVWLTVKVQ